MMTGVALLAAEIGDPDSTRTVIAIIALLVVVGLALVMLAFWLRRTTRPDPEFLAPLEVMGERSWLRGDPVWQRRRLDEVRPESAAPLKRAALPPRLDESFDAGPSGSGFDDLRPEEEVSPAPTPSEPVEATVDPTTAADTTAIDDAHEVDAVDGDAAADVEEDDGLDDDVDDDDVERFGDAREDGADDNDHDRDIDDDRDEDRVDEDGADEVEDMRTPIGSPRPLLDDLPERDIDPAVLEQAMAELDAELQRRGNDS
jgi:hypothetical protein